MRVQQLEGRKYGIGNVEVLTPECKGSKNALHHQRGQWCCNQTSVLGENDQNDRRICAKFWKYSTEDREARRKTPVHDDHEVATVQPNILQKTSAGKGKRNQSVKGSGLPSQGLSGGLWILWERSVVVEVIMSESWFIHCKLSVKVNGVNECFLLSCVYGNSKSFIRRLQWPVFTMFKLTNDESWLLMGDFNEITCQEEKCGGKLFNYSKVRTFLDMMDDCELLDLGFVGSIYTWTNRQNGRHRIWERIDRMMANEVWRSRFSDCRVLHEVPTSSDHKFLILKLIQDGVNVR
ncbi:hypothetical protein IFM89_010865 [Coptis chinensis]|uniref:Uncharacterized protein n=1 Tax=Coptis chinensis TaxID=261450 RepID=A0A835I2C5_9MAGN|nr:hypothetical protein IFM89_010865 [Coptis chinensis]